MCKKKLKSYIGRHHGDFKGLRIIKFSITEKITRNEVDEATLNVHVQQPEHSHDISRDHDYITVDLQVSRVTKNSLETRALVMYSEKSYKVTRKELRLGKWMKVNVTTLVAEFFSLPREHLEIVVKVQDTNKLNLMVPLQKSEYNNTLMPYIEISLKDNTHTRTRRTIGMECNEKIKEERCCRYPLIVSFEDFGWDWIIAPKEYAASYCSGTCPYSFLQKYPHTHLTHLARGGGPCCAPRKLSSISMLYFDEHLNIIFETVPGMVVDSCGCS